MTWNLIRPLVFKRPLLTTPLRSRPIFNWLLDASQVECFTMQIALQKSLFFKYRIEGQRSTFMKALETNAYDRMLIGQVIESVHASSKQKIIQLRDEGGGPMGKHAYFQSTPLGKQPRIDPRAAKKVLSEAFMNFPSMVPTKFSSDERTATLNKNDNVTVSELFSYEVKVGDTTWTVIGLSAVTQDEHALGGQLDHMILQNQTTNESHTLRMGVGHLRTFDTPGTSIADLINEIAGGLAWCAADRYARVLLGGESTSSRSAIEELDRATGMKVAKFSFTVGGMFSRGVMQPVQRVLFRNTPESLAIAYLLLVMFVIYYSAKSQEAGEDREER